MRYLLVATSIALSLLAFAAGCSSQNESAEDGNQAIAEEAFSADTIGVYELASENYGADIAVTNIAPFTFDLTVVRRSGGNFGDLQQRVAREVSPGHAVFEGAGDCKLDIEAAGGALTLKQTGTCREEGFGLWVDGSGTYSKQVPPTDEDLGEYKMRAGGMDAKLTIKTIQPFAFDLSVVAEGGSGRHGILEGANAALRGNTATFLSEDDCRIEMKFGSGSIEVHQEGTCGSAGFGAFIDASGKYVR